MGFETEDQKIDVYTAAWCVDLRLDDDDDDDEEHEEEEEKAGRALPCWRAMNALAWSIAISTMMTPRSASTAA